MRSRSGKTLMAKIQLDGYKCERCDHEWVPRDKTEKPTICPKCKSPYWDKPRKVDSREAGGLTEAGYCAACHDKPHEKVK